MNDSKTSMMTNSRPLEKGLMADILFWSQMAFVELLETLSSYYIGNAIIKSADNFLWVLEKTSQWSLPNYNYDNAEKSKITSELVRPLPWILFLPLLLILRIIREGLSFGALMMGKEPIRPSTIISYIQTSRESLQSLRSKGLKKLQMKDNPAANQDALQHKFVEGFKRIFTKIESVLCFNAVKYYNGNRRIVRQNSGELVQIKTPRRRQKQSNEENCERSSNEDSSSFSSESVDECLDREVNVDVHHDDNENVRPIVNSDINTVDHSDEASSVEKTLMNGESNMRPNVNDANRKMLQSEQEVVNKNRMVKNSSHESEKFINSESGGKGNNNIVKNNKRNKNNHKPLQNIKRKAPMHILSPEIIITESENEKTTSF